MKKTLLIAITAITALPVFANRKHATPARTATSTVNNSGYILDGARMKTTAAGDTLILRNVAATDTPTLYYAGMLGRDSGYVSGMDVYGDQGFAERYDFSTGDSSLNVIGMITLFGGKVNPASTKTVSFNCWSQGALAASSYPDWYDNGLPDVSLASVSVPITRLGIASTDTVADTFKTFMFTTPTGFLHDSFFVGYTITYDATNFGGDTIGVFTTQDGDRTSPNYTTSGTDTIMNNKNCTMFDDGSWYDNASDNFYLSNNYLMFPIVVVHRYLSVNGISNRNLTFYGNYPNPASTSTNIKFSLASGSDVTITIVDIAGRVVKTQTEKQLGAGEHIVSLDVTSLAAGEYTYVVRVANGGGIASKLTVAK